MVGQVHPKNTPRGGLETVSYSQPTIEAARRGTGTDHTHEGPPPATVPDIVNNVFEVFLAHGSADSRAINEGLDILIVPQRWPLLELFFFFRERFGIVTPADTTAAFDR